MALDFTPSQISLMSASDIADIERAKAQGFSMPGYTRLSQSAVSGGIVPIKQLFSPAALRVVSGGKHYPESATPENCEKLIAIWNANGGAFYAML
jgi:hypothetical protein